MRLREVEVKEAVVRADRESMDATTNTTTCPYRIGQRIPAPSNRQGLANARRLMKRYAGTEFGVSKNSDGHWVVVRYA